MMTAPKMCLQVLAKLSGAWLLLLAILVLSSSANRATARPVVWQSLTAYPSPVHARFLQQSVNGTEVNAMVDRSAKPATPMTRLGEELPDGVSATSADVGNITVSMTIQGTSQAEFRASYLATIAAVTGRTSGTPATQWRITITTANGSIMAVTDSNSTATASSSNSSTTATVSIVSDNSTKAKTNNTSGGLRPKSTAGQNSSLQLATTNQTLARGTAAGQSQQASTGSSSSSSNNNSNSTEQTSSITIGGKAASAGGSSSSSNGAGQTAGAADASSTKPNSNSSGGTRRLLQLDFDIRPMTSAGRSLQEQQQQQVEGEIRVTLDLFTVNPKLVALRLTQATSAAAAAAAAALRNSCSTEYCARLVAAGIPVDSSSISVTPDYTDDISRAITAAKAHQDASRKQFLGAVLGGTIGGASALLLIVLAAWRLSKRHLKAAATCDQKQLADGTADDPEQPDQEGEQKLLHRQPRSSSHFPDKAVTDQLHAVAAALKPVSRQQSGLAPVPIIATTSGPIATSAAADDSDRSHHETDYFPVTGYERDTFRTRKSSDSRRSSFGRRSFGDRPRSSGEFLRYDKGPDSSTNDGTTAAGAAGTAATSAGLALPPFNTGQQSPTPYPAVLSTYGTPSAKATPEVIPQPQQMSVDPDQLNQALAQYYASVIQMHQVLDPVVIAHGASPLQTPPHHSPGHSRSNSQTAVADLEMQIGGAGPRSTRQQLPTV